jgi:hypothetical protein
MIRDLEAAGSSLSLVAAEERLAVARERADRARVARAAIEISIKVIYDGINPVVRTAAWTRLREGVADAGEA